MTTRRFRRPARLAGPAMPGGELTIEAPPEIPRTLPRNWLFLAFPAVMVLTSVGFVVVAGFSATSMMMGAMMAVSTVGLMAGGAGQGPTRGQLDQDRRDYLRYLAQTRHRLGAIRDAQRAALSWRHPDPAALLTVVPGRRTWERRRTHADFLQVRVASGRQRLAVRLAPPQTGPVEDLEPTSLVALRRLLRAHAVVADLPIAVQLRGFPAVALRGEAAAARGVARAMVAELAAFHAPDDLMIAVVTDTARRGEWDWVKWLPHNQHPRLTDAIGSCRLVARSLATVEDWLATELATRARFSRGQPHGDGPFVLIVIDGGQVAGTERIVADGGLSGVALLELVDPAARVDGPSVAGRRALRLEVRNGEVGVRARQREVEWLGTMSPMSVAEAETVARHLAPLRLVSGDVRADEPLVTATELTDLLAIGDAGAVTVSRLWQPRSAREHLRVPIGVSDAGAPVELDLKEAAQDGMGPHGLVIGATGSGKSEVLRTLVLGLAATHSSVDLNFVLIDFKGGATFAGLGALPHTAAVITNLSDDLAMVDRMHSALSGEINRRQELLRAAGNLANVRDYERARVHGVELDPLPALVIVCDEFSELLSQKPDFAELFVTIGRLGRSLAIHLLLASQRLEEGRLRGLDSHLSYRIGLKTFSAAESRAVLGVADAYHLPPIPGSAFLKYDTESMVRFKAAYVSGPYMSATSADPARPEPANGLGHRFTADPVVEEEAPTVHRALAVPARTATAERVAAESVLDVLVSRLMGAGPPAHEVWLAPLVDSPTVDQLLPAFEATSERGLAVPDFERNGALAVPIGVVDKPFEQRRESWWIDLSGGAGHAVVVGGPQSGKSTTLRTIVTALAVLHTPAEVQFYAIDLGGGSLAGLAGLPHVGAIAGRQDAELVQRIIAELTALIARREQSFRVEGIDSMRAFRRQRTAGRTPGGRSADGVAGDHDEPRELATQADRHGDVFVVIDGWRAFGQDFADLEPQVQALAAQGLSYGVHLVLGAGRWADVRPAVRDQLGTRIELRLGDPSESELDRRAAATVPVGQPGRALTGQKDHALVALPRIDSRPTAADLVTGVSDLVRRVHAAWVSNAAHRLAPPIHLLPTRLSRSALPALRTVVPPPAPAATDRIPIGLDEADLAPVYLEIGAEPHFLVFGDTESGKSSFLRLVVDALVERYAADQVRLLAIDYRRSLLERIPADYRAGYAGSAPAAAALCADLQARLSDRLPGPDVTGAQLRERSWWSGREAFVLVDDYDLVATASGNPLSALLELLPQARDIGLHLIICRRTGGAARAVFEPVLQRIRELGSPGLVLSGSRDEGALLGSVRPAPRPPGRGTLVRRRAEPMLIQLALPDPT